MYNKSIYITSSQWFSDVEDDDNIENLDDPQTAKCLTFTEFQSMKNRNLEELMKFSNIGIFREALTDWVVRNGYELEYKKKMKGSESLQDAKNQVVIGGFMPLLYKIKITTWEHTCSKRRVNKHATAKYICKKMEYAIKENLDVPIQKLGYSVLRKVGVEAGYLKNLRAKMAALDKIRGKDAQEYNQLWDYCETILPSLKECTLFSLPSMMMGFLAGCMPLIGLDDCFLKTPHGGQLLCVTGRDGNDNLFPIALAVVPVENMEAWNWFLTELLDEIGGVEEQKWTFISNRQ
ncbi:PREDICTED: uncharacterized protein LOC105950266 [Erythranthe guttata]|uniref:uncharacterized protein LOC105950266 n=1 Tax=Erythranthe guttata TaxID=4155 RepID=UPI00064DA8C0|nr:PREDICTED: uncharacterized protein LOC105950266 [Erythranthe guttata]|eukprot:XP_012829073.1 PREDICTED: uncharacterized protein LOC105950266 [Erythranthe guttata]